MVGVHVCGVHALERPCQRPLRHEGQPVGNGVGGVQAGIYQYPAIMGVYGPYIDVVEPEWHGQPDPAHTRGDLDPVAWCWWLEWVGQCIGCGINHYYRFMG